MAVTNFESGSSFPPLPPGKSGREVTRSKTFIDIEILGTLVGNDIYSSNWDGSIPLNIDDDGDSAGMDGFALDASTGHIQAARLFVGVGTTLAHAISYIEDPTTGIDFLGAGIGPDGGDGSMRVVCSDGANFDIGNSTTSRGIFGIGHSDGGVTDLTLSSGSVELQGGGGVEGRLTYRSSPTAQSGTAIVLYSNGTDYDLVPLSSTKRHKKYITRRDDLADIELIPSRWQRRGRKPLVGHQRPEGDNPWEYGLIAEDLIEQDSTLGIWDQNTGRYDDYDTRAVIAVLAAKANKSDDDVAALTATVATLLDRVAELESRLAETSPEVPSA